MELLWKLIGVMFGFGVAMIVLVIGILGTYLAIVTIETIIDERKKANKKGEKKNGKSK